jgi:hypothetical protein
VGKKIHRLFSLFFILFVYKNFLFPVETQCIASLRRAEEGLKVLSSIAQGNALWIKAICRHSPAGAGGA